MQESGGWVVVWPRPGLLPAVLSPGLGVNGHPQAWVSLRICSLRGALGGVGEEKQVSTGPCQLQNKGRFWTVSEAQPRGRGAQDPGVRLLSRAASRRSHSCTHPSAGAQRAEGEETGGRAEHVPAHWLLHAHCPVLILPRGSGALPVFRGASRRKDTDDLA